MNYLNGRVEDNHVFNIAILIDKGHLDDARDLILGYSDHATVACVTLLVVDALKNVTGKSRNECSNRVYRMLEVRTP